MDQVRLRTSIAADDQEEVSVDKQNIIIHIEWDGPYRFWDNPSQLDPVSSLIGSTDYGIYQIYGGRPVYGNSALLYIGMAEPRNSGNAYHGKSSGSTIATQAGLRFTSDVFTEAKRPMTLRGNGSSNWPRGC